MRNAAGKRRNGFAYGFDVIRVLAALVLFLQLRFDIGAPLRQWAEQAINGPSRMHGITVELAGWAVSAIFAGLFVMRTHIGQRLPVRKPGMILLTLGLAATVLGVAGAGRFGDAFRESTYSRTMVAHIWMLVSGGFSVPMTTIGSALMGMGLLRVLFDLDPLPETSATRVERPSANGAVVAAPNAAELGAVRAECAARPDDEDLHGRLHELLLRDIENSPELRNHGREYLSLLVRRAKHHAALDVYAQLRARDAAFAPAPDDIVALAEAALANRQYQLTARLVNRFDQRHPEHSANALIYLYAGKALIGLEREEQATKVLQALLQRHGNASQAWEAKVLLRSLGAKRGADG